jgi:hypothetical protein
MKNKGVNINGYIDAMAIQEGVTMRSDCPVCGHKNSFSATNLGGSVVYNCFHADCGISGKVRHGIFSTARMQKERKRLTLSMYRQYFVPVSRSQKAVQYIKDNNIYHAYSQKLANLEHDVRENRVVFLIYDDDNVLIDAVGRSLTNRKPKWKRYCASRVPFVTNNKADTCVIVEDCASACAVTQAGVVGVALMGTNLVDNYINYIKKYKTAIVALDKDASKKSLTISKELFAHMSVHNLFIETDIKTWDTDKINEKFRVYSS